jgi:hypothetical protein
LEGLHVPEDSKPTPVSDTTNVWCLSGLDVEDVFFLVHVVGPMEEDAVGYPDSDAQAAGLM